eukprot:6436-Heterococcus_DN1.PRE.7
MHDIQRINEQQCQHPCATKVHAIDCTHYNYSNSLHTRTNATTRVCQPCTADYTDSKTTVAYCYLVSRVQAD